MAEKILIELELPAGLDHEWFRTGVWQLILRQLMLADVRVDVIRAPKGRWVPRKRPAPKGAQG